MSMLSKKKEPERVYNPYVAEIVKGQSNRIISTKEESRGFRFDCWEVVFQLPNATEQAGFSKATKARLDSTKLQGLGWKAKYDIREGIRRTMKMMRA